MRVFECVLKESYIEFPKTVGQPDALYLVNNAVSLLSRNIGNFHIFIVVESKEN